MVAVGVTLGATLAAACGSDRGKGEAALAVDGQVRITSRSRVSAIETDGGNVGRGDTVTVMRGTAELSFGRGRRMELRRGTTVTVDEVPVVSHGDALLIADDTPFRAQAAGTSVVITQGVARVTRELGLEAASYRGRITISSAGRRMTVPALRRATVASLGVLPGGVEPVRLVPTDAWDRRYLGEAMEWSEQLQATSDGMTAQLVDDVAHDRAFFTNLLPELRGEPSFKGPLLDPERPPGETIVGAAIALDSRGGSFAQRWREVFAFRDDGAAWGLVAMDQRLDDTERVSEALEFAFGRAESYTVQAAAKAKQVEELAAAPIASEEPESESETSPPRPARPTSPPTTAPPAQQPPLLGIEILPPPPDGEEREPIRNTLDTVEGLVSGLLSSLR